MDCDAQLQYTNVDVLVAPFNYTCSRLACGQCFLNSFFFSLTSVQKSLNPTCCFIICFFLFIQLNIMQHSSNLLTILRLVVTSTATLSTYIFIIVSDIPLQVTWRSLSNYLYETFSRFCIFLIKYLVCLQKTIVKCPVSLLVPGQQCMKSNKADSYQQLLCVMETSSSFELFSSYKYNTNTIVFFFVCTTDHYLRYVQRLAL